MKKYIKVLKRTQMFAGVIDDEISSMLNCLGARLKNYKKGEYVLRQGEHLSDIIVLVEGNLHIQKDDYWGNRSILGQISVGELFGEAYIAPESSALLNDVVAVEDSTIILFDVKRIITTCPSACRFHAMVVQNMFFAISEKTEDLYKNLDICQSVLQEKSLFPICQRRQKNKTLQALRFRLTANSLPIFCRLTEAQCQTSFVKCVMMAF